MMCVCGGVGGGLSRPQREKAQASVQSVCVCCHEIFSKIFAQRPLWMSEITSELEFNALVLKTADCSPFLILFPPLNLSLFYSLIYSFL